jgi:hypothetical protein
MHTIVPVFLAGMNQKISGTPMCRLDRRPIEPLWMYVRSASKGHAMRNAHVALTVAAITCFPAAALAQWTGGPVIISGLDVELHQNIFQGGNQPDPSVDRINWSGILYVLQGFDYITNHLDLSNLTGRETVVCLGCNGGRRKRAQKTGQVRLLGRKEEMETGTQLVASPSSPKPPIAASSLRP